MADSHGAQIARQVFLWFASNEFEDETEALEDGVLDLDSEFSSLGLFVFEDKERDDNEGTAGLGDNSEGDSSALAVVLIIASEAANNAKDGGSLIPTLAFGIPGSAEMAVFLGVLVLHGLEPGPRLLLEHEDVIYGLKCQTDPEPVVGKAFNYRCPPPRCQSTYNT